MTARRIHPEQRTIHLSDETATVNLARGVAGIATPRDVIALWGELGAGKTTFARAFINALPRPDSAAPEEVPSPTFTLVQVYRRAPAPIWHIDLYRLEHAEEAYELGLEEALAEGISLIEWPDRLGPLLPFLRLDIRLEFGAEPQARVATLQGSETWPRRLRDLPFDG
jgi:tRNA threonylcarbamoyladenosine biosynthesis protein TsaE